MKKILLAPINAVVWISHNPAETMLLFVFGISMLPFFMSVASPSLLGGLIVFFACMAEKYVFRYEKQTRLYSVLAIIILLIGVIAMFTVGDKDYQSNWTPMDNFWVTYIGAFWGMMIAHFWILLMDNEKENRKRQKELDNIVLERQKEQRIISQKEKEGLIAIKREGKLIGYIEKEKYDLFVNENIKNEN